MLLALLAAGTMLVPAQEPQEREREREGKPVPQGVRLQLSDKSFVTVRDFAIQLRSLKMAELRRSNADLLIIDPYGGVSVPASQVRRLQKSRSGRRIVIAYLPVAELSTRSPLWSAKWDANRDGKPDTGAPAWLGNRQGDGDYAVRYWLPAWKSFLFEGRDSLVQRLIRAGYDGMAMDVGPAFKTKEISAHDAEQALGKLLYFTTTKARGIKRRFYSLIMNPSEIRKYGDILLMHDGLLVDGFFYGHEQPGKKSSEEYLDAHEEILEELAREGRIILTVAYTRDPAQIRENARKSKAIGALPFATSRAMDRLPNQ
jgi:cysteinyl-tRNA synthetase, unknown class